MAERRRFELRQHHVLLTEMPRTRDQEDQAEEHPEGEVGEGTEAFEDGHRVALPVRVAFTARTCVACARKLHGSCQDVGRPRQLGRP